MGRETSKESLEWAENDAVYQANKIIDINEDDFELDDDTSDVLGLGTSLYRGEGENTGDWFERVFEEI